MANINDRINGQEFESASPLAHAVRYDRAQVKTEEQKKQARENIGCYCEAGGGSGGGSSGGSSGGGVNVVGVNFESGVSFDKTAAEIIEMAETGPVFTKVVVTEGQTIIKNFGIIRAVIDATDEGGGYVFELLNESNVFEASSLDEYPHLEQHQ